MAVFGISGCATRTNVSATANVPAQYAHVWLTVEQLWLNTSAAAGPDDSDWQKTTLSTPQTIDLVGLTNGELSLFANQVKVPSGTYRQLRIVLSDPAGPLTTSAQDAGLRFNDEVDYFDGNGVEQQARLELANSEKGMAIAMTLTVPTATSLVLAGMGSSSSSTTSSSSTPATTTSATDTTTSRTVAAASAAVDFDASRDLAPFTYGGQPGFVLNPHLSGYDLATVGVIRGQVNVTALTTNANTGRLDVMVSAETLSGDSTRHVVVKNAPLRSDGSFILYPLSMSTGSPTSYDLVIHGPLVETVIIKSVPVTSGGPLNATPAALDTVALVAATSFNVNVAAGSAVSPRGARVGFYQTLPGSGEVPYVVEERPIDPISGRFADDQSMSSGDLVFGTFISGQTLPLSTATPVEGQATYQVAASAALFSDGALRSPVSAPRFGGTGTVGFTAPVLSVEPTASADTIDATINIASPGRYDHGELVITHDGAIVATVSLDTILAQASTTLTVSAVPGGVTSQSYASGLYYAEVWAWNSSDPAGTFNRQPNPAVIDLRLGNAGGVTIDII
jgi:hypothetical protein